MQPKEEFEYLIETLKDRLANANLAFSLQTNATLVTKKWVELLNKHNVGVGVSIDGPRSYNDKHRIDHQNNGSYDRVVRGIKLLQDGLTTPPGCLTVINPEFSGTVVYRHLVDLGFKNLDFLLPDNNHHNLPPHPTEKYTKFLNEVFSEWSKDDKKEISIRKFKSIILQLLGQKSLIYGFGRGIDTDLPLLSIRSDGAVSPTDELMSTDPMSVTDVNKNVSTSTLREVINCEIFDELRQAHQTASDKCLKCCWYNACGGGNLVSRFSLDKRFNNHSVYCDSLQEIYANIAYYLISSGVSQKTITDNLFRDLQQNV